MFCIKIADQEKPWFRYVPTDAFWNPILGILEDGSTAAEVTDDTLTALSNADPNAENTPRYLPQDVYDKVFGAWEIARESVYSSWQYLTNPNNLIPDIEKTFRDAAELVYEHGKFLGNDLQAELVAKLSGRWPNDIKRSVREILVQEDLTSREKVEKLQILATEFGLSIPKAPVPLPAITEAQVRLVAWMAVAKAPSSRT